MASSLRWYVGPQRLTLRPPARLPRPNQPSLENPRAKLSRANEHLEALYAEAYAFADRDPYAITQDRREDGRLLVVGIRIIEPPPLRFGLILGDVLHNWRSALDNLAYQLVLLGRRKVPGKRETIGFPIFDTERSFNAVGVKRIKGVRDDHAAIIESLQPYPGRDAAPHKALAALSAYENADKHRAIHPAFAVFADPAQAARSFRREPEEAEFTIEFDPVGFGKPLEDGMEVAHLRFSGPSPQPNVKMQAELPVETAFGNAGLRLKALPAIRREIHGIVGRFEADFP